MKITRQNILTASRRSNQDKSFRYFIETDSHEETERRGWSFYNHKATYFPELNWVSDTCGWFYASQENMLRGMENIALAELLNARSDEFKKKKGGALAEAKRIAAERFAAIEEETGEREIQVNPHVYRAFSPSARQYDDMKDYIIKRAYNC